MGSEEPRSIFVLDLAALLGSHRPLRSSCSSFHITDEESESPLVAEPGKTQVPSSHGGPAHHFLNLGPPESKEKWRVAIFS